MRIADKTKEQLSEELEALRLHVTELEKAEAERRGMDNVLGRSKEQLQNLLEEAPIGICNADLKGKITYVNKRFEEVSGYSRREVVGKSGFKLGMFSAEGLRLLAKRLGERLRGRPSRLLEMQFKCKDGHWIWVALEGKIMIEKGIPVGFQIISRDITERKRAEEVLQVEKNKLQSVIDALEYGLTIMDAEYNIVYQNEHFRGTSGDRVGEKCYRAYEGRDKVCDDCPVAKAFRDGESHTSERKVVAPSGEVTFWEHVANPVRDTKGRITSCLEVTIDITERKQVAEALQVEKNKLQSVIDALEDALTIQDRDYNILYQSKPSVMTRGYHLGEKCYRAYEGSDKVCDGCPVAKAFRDGKSHTSERKVVTPSGKVLFLENTANPIRNAKGEIVSCLEISRNVTERKQAEEKLKESQEFASSLLENAPNPVEVINPDASIRYVNPAFEKLTGFTLAEIVGMKPPYPWWPKESKKEINAALKEDMAGDSVVRERISQRKNGERFWAVLSTVPVTRDGTLKYFLLNWLDITDRKQAEEKLRESEERYRHLFESSHDMIQSVAPDGRFLFVNRAWLETMGYTEAELPELNLFKMIHPGSLPHCQEMFSEVMAGETVTNVQATFVAKDGRSVLVEGSAVGRYIGGKLYATQGIFRDITERKQAEEKLRESEVGLTEAQRVAKMGSWDMDPATGAGTWSAEMFRLTGFAPSKGTPSFDEFLEWVHPEDQQRISLDFHERVRQTGKSATSELRSNPARGPVRNFLANVSARCDTQGHVVKMMGTLQDITERKQAEEALRQSQEQLLKIFGSVTEGIIVVDLNGVITEVNQRTVEMHGFGSRDGLLGKSALELIAPGDRERVAKSMRQAVKKGAIRGVEYALLRADGSEFLGELSTSVLKDASGDVVGHITIVRDITERKQAEKVFEALATSSPIGIYIIQDQAFQFVSPQFQTLLGYNEDELLAMDPLKFVQPEDREMVRESAIRMLKGEHSYPYEYRYISKDGQTKWVMETVASIQYRGKRATLGNFLDITERKQAEEALERQRAYFQQLFDNSPDAIAWLDTDDRFVNVNRGFETLFGYRLEEAKGQLALDLIVPEDRAEELTASSRTLLAGKAIRMETLRKRGDGSLVDVSIIGYPIWFGDKIVGKYIIYSDITERKRVQEALRESQEFSSNLLENSPDPIFVVNPDTSIKYINPAFEKLTGFALDEIIGRKAPYPWWPEEQRKEIADAFKDAMVSGGNRDEWIRRKKNGERFWVAINSAPIMHEGRLSYFLVHWLDITERKQAEEERIELEQKAHLASRLASVGEMASGIAHEINNPMTAVIGFSQLLMEANLPDDVKEDIAVIHKEAQRAAGVARNLLTFARKHAPAKQLTNVNSIVEGVLKLRAYEQSVSNIRVNTRLAPDLPEVMADYSQMQQVFINIILNAEAAMLETGNGGKLTITTQRTDGSVRASFTDSGPGIARENLNRIFDPFFTTKEVGKGTGLGLSVCHGIVAEHGGRLYARSKLGHGATFVVELPINAHSSDGGS